MGSRPSLTGVSRALRARNPRRASARVSQGSKIFLCPKQSRKSLRSLKKDCFETPETLLRLFRTHLDSSGLRARETPVKGGRAPNLNCQNRQWSRGVYCHGCCPRAVVWCHWERKKPPKRSNATHTHPPRDKLPPSSVLKNVQTPATIEVRDPKRNRGWIFQDQLRDRSYITTTDARGSCDNGVGREFRSDTS